MYTPHPSLVPIEMASAGMLAVTNSFENKTAEAMARDLREPDHVVEPSLDGIVQGLREAVAGVGDATSRAEGARVRWSRDWDTSFDEEIIGRIAPSWSRAERATMILITGGAGFVGSNLAVSLAVAAPRWEIVALDNLYRRARS